MMCIHSSLSLSHRNAAAVFPALHCHYQKPLRKANSLYRTPPFLQPVLHVYCVSIKNYAPHERRAGGKLEIITRFYDNNILFYNCRTPRRSQNNGYRSSSSHELLFLLGIFNKTVYVVLHKIVFCT